MDEKKQKYHTALDLLKKGDLNQSKIFFEELLNTEPNNHEILHYLGIIEYQQKNYNKALTYYDKAIQIHPTGIYNYNMGSLFRTLKMSEQAINYFKTAIELDPQNPEFSKAIGSLYLQKANYDEAYKYFNESLALQPNDPDTLSSIANIYFIKNKFDDAQKIYNKLIGLLPNNASFYSRLGTLLLNKNQYNEAINYLKKAIELEPSHIDSYYNLGILHFNIHNFDEALKYFYEVLKLDSNNVEAYFRIGKAFLLKNNTKKTIEYCSSAININPNHVESHYSLGGAYYLESNYDLSYEHFKKVIELNPNYFLAYNNLGAIERKRKNREESKRYYEIAIKLNPNIADTYNNLANIYIDLNEEDEAIKLSQKALQLNPDMAEAYNSIGLALTNKNELTRAVEYFNKAISIKGPNIESFYNIGNANFFALNFQESEKYYLKTLELNPQYHKSLSNLGLLYLLNQYFEKGWKYYEYRFFTEDYVDYIDIQPRWKGESLENKTIFVYHEQGFGDNIQFIRYLPILKSMGAERIIFASQDELYQLFKQSDLETEVYKNAFVLYYNPKNPDCNHSNPGPSVRSKDNTFEPVKYDYAIPILSIPGVLKTNFDNIPECNTSYLKTDKEKVAYYKENYFNNNCFKLGICWQGSTGNKNDRNRSMNLNKLYKFATLPNVKVYSIQKGDAIKQLDNLPKEIDIVNLGETFEDFADTAAAIENLDLLISIDTSVIHVAGALMKPTWVLLGYRPDWRWFLNYEDTKWYQSLKILRQPEWGNWDVPIERAYNMLNDILNCSYK